MRRFHDDEEWLALVRILTAPRDEPMSDDDISVTARRLELLMRHVADDAHSGRNTDVVDGLDKLVSQVERSLSALHLAFMRKR